MKERFSSHIYFFSLYFIAVSVLYLWGYWSTFNINILAYMSLSDMIKTSAYPIASFFIMILIGAVLGDLIPDHRLEIGGGRDTKIGKWLNRYVRYILSVYFIVVYVGFLFGGIQK